MLTKEQILGADDLRFVEVDVPEWGGVVRGRTMTAGERDQLEMYMIDAKNKRMAVRAMTVALTAVDENDNRIFEASDVEKLAKKSAKALERVFRAFSKLNAMSVGDVEELEKN